MQGIDIIEGGKAFSRNVVPIDAVLADLPEERAFEFPVERAEFVATLHRLFVSGSGSDGDYGSRMEDYDIPGARKVWSCITSIGPWPGWARSWRRSRPGRWRCAHVNDPVEEKLFDRRRDLFTDLSN